MQKGDVLLCPKCDLVLAQATEPIPLGLMHWWNKLRPIELTRMPAMGTPQNEIRCPRCSTPWYPNFVVARKETTTAPR